MWHSLFDLLIDLGPERGHQLVNVFRWKQFSILLWGVGLSVSSSSSCSTRGYLTGKLCITLNGIVIFFGIFLGYSKDDFIVFSMFLRRRLSVEYQNIRLLNSSVSEQDEPNPALWSTTRAGKMELSFPLGSTRELMFVFTYNKSFIDQAYLVKKDRYWPPSLSINTPIPSHLDLTLSHISQLITHWHRYHRRPQPWIANFIFPRSLSFVELFVCPKGERLFPPQFRLFLLRSYNA